jgi:hypothetical protein
MDPEHVQFHGFSSDEEAERRASPVQERQRAPLRVIPLAIGAVFATLSVAAIAAEASRELSQDRYAEEILKDAL